LNPKAFSQRDWIIFFFWALNREFWSQIRKIILVTRNCILFNFLHFFANDRPVC
jgi:hypothetical protein